MSTLYRFFQMKGTRGSRKSAQFFKFCIVSSLCAMVGLLLWSTCYKIIAVSQGIQARMEKKPSDTTLGFDKIYALTLPSRTDRQDAIEIMAAYTDIEIELVYGPKGENVDEVSFPLGMTREKTGNGYIGSWRGHLNILRKVIHERIATALIIEDDVDWDVELKSQMRAILGMIDTLDFAKDWDVLWLGTLGEQPSVDDNRSYLMHDYTVPSELTGGFTNLFQGLPNQTRIIHPSNIPLTTNAYAVSNLGAKKILYQMSLSETWDHFDTDLANRCRIYLNCISVSPGVFHEFRLSGSKLKDSNNWHHLEHGQREKPLISKNVKQSVRKMIESQLTTPIRLNRERISNKRWDEIWSTPLIHDWAPEERLLEAM